MYPGSNAVMVIYQIGKTNAATSISFVSNEHDLLNLPTEKARRAHVVLYGYCYKASARMEYLSGKTFHTKSDLVHRLAVRNISIM